MAKVSVGKNGQVLILVVVEDGLVPDEIRMRVEGLTLS